jgi:hypothetical protein
MIRLFCVLAMLATPTFAQNPFYAAQWPDTDFSKTIVDLDTIRSGGLVLPRFSSGLFRAMFAMKEIKNGNEIHRRVSA